MENILMRAEDGDILNMLHKRFVKIFLDWILLNRIDAISSASGYDLTQYVYQHYGMLLSPGTVYSTLYSMERQGLIVGAWRKRSRTYHITDEGKRAIQLVNKRFDAARSIYFRLGGK